MAILETRYYKSHKNIYMEEFQDMDRNIRVEMGLPENGVNEDTGILIFLPGYGGDIESHVFCRMRNEFSDKYNCITMQCDYFGNRFMKEEYPDISNAILFAEEVLACHVLFKKETKETDEEFNDMGIMQALDIVSATIGCINELNEKNILFDVNKIILFGISHGAYLAYLANLICPNLYSCLLDISAYIIPYYLRKPRRVLTRNGQEKKCEVIQIQFLNKNPLYCYSENLYDLSFLYKNQKNSCKILCFQGEADGMVNSEEKEQFISNVPNAEIFLIKSDEVDGRVFKNVDHGLGLDFFFFFEWIMPTLNKMFCKKGRIELTKKVILGDSKEKIVVSYESGLPELVEITKNKEIKNKEK